MSAMVPNANMIFNATSWDFFMLSPHFFILFFPLSQGRCVWIEKVALSKGLASVPLSDTFSALNIVHRVPFSGFGLKGRIDPIGESKGFFISHWFLSRGSENRDRRQPTK